jgi:pyruvate/2-oxoglutarate dehydrogenase complex dihydrolipoamide acyltransferase (E2) component
VSTVILRIPKAAVSMQNGIISKWLVDDGTTVIEGQPIYELEIEKTMMEVESPAAGLLRQKAVAGEEFAVGEIIGEIIGE